MNTEYLYWLAFRRRSIGKKPTKPVAEYHECWDTFDNWENDPNFDYEFVIKPPYCVNPVCGSNCVYPEDAYVSSSYPALLAYCKKFKFRNGRVKAKVTIDYAFFEEGRKVCDPNALVNTELSYLGIVLRYIGTKCYSVVFRLERWDTQINVRLDRFSYHEPPTDEYASSPVQEEHSVVVDYGEWVNIEARVSDAPNGVKLEGYVEGDGEGYVMEDPYIIDQEGYAGISLGIGYYDVYMNIHIATIDDIYIRKED